MGNIVKKSVPSLIQQKIVMANVVTRAAHSLTLAEKRILMAGIARLGGKNERVKISAAEYAETYDVSLDTAYGKEKKKELSVSVGLADTAISIRKVMSASVSVMRFSPTSSN